MCKFIQKSILAREAYKIWGLDFVDAVMGESPDVDLDDVWLPGHN